MTKPDAYERRCEWCSQYLLTQTGEPRKDGNGQPLVSSAPRLCRMVCRCEGPLEKPVFTNRNDYVYRLWKRCRQYKTLPHSGSIMEQDLELMQQFEVFDQLQDRIDRAREEAGLGILGRLGAR